MGKSFDKLCGTNYPLSICFIVVNEFCERFSYYGMKALLTLYFVTYLKWDKDLSTAVYHAFSGLCYFTPILGAIIADSWLGKFRTIIYLSIVYVIGHVVKSVGAIPTVGNTDVHIALSMVGLILIAIGTGGIKPCVAAFGGDQFDEEHVSERQKFFSIFYMSINAGSLLSTLITPVLRGDVKCFGGDCYALAFGVPAALMIVALVVFIAGSSLYKRNPPQGNILLQVCKCIGFAIKNRWRNSKHEPKRKHWLDWAEEKYSKRLIQEVKMVLRVLVLYIPLPMFWALFDQQVWVYKPKKTTFSQCVSVHYSRFWCIPVKDHRLKLSSHCPRQTVEDNVEKNTDGKPYVRFFSTLQEAMNITVGQVNFYAPPDYSMSSNVTVDRNEYPAVHCDLQSEDCPGLNLGLLDFGASYTFILMKESGQIVAHRMEDVKANSVHIAWQIPQYVLLTAGEVMFSITGLEFSYSQAPSNMKSVLQAGWLLTVAFGNVIVLIVAEGAGLEQWKEFVLFAGLLLGVCIIFSVMSVFYKYVEPENMDKINLEDTKEEDEGDGKKSSMMLDKTGKSTKL
uniref:Solute carrier family 15 member 2 n=1 Tax=Oryzias sinensis TaxID=183150 RepID=A0A8C7YGI0_9TELE